VAPGIQLSWEVGAASESAAGVQKLMLGVVEAAEQSLFLHAPETAGSLFSE